MRKKNDICSVSHIPILLNKVYYFLPYVTRDSIRTYIYLVEQSRSNLFYDKVLPLIQSSMIII